MDIKTAREYLTKAHMNRKVANYLIQTIDELEDKVSNNSIPSSKSFKGFFKSYQQIGYVKAMGVIEKILRKED